MSLTEHVEIGRLFDFVRTGSSLGASAEAHLETCAECRRKVSWMRIMAGTGSEELRYEPPESIMKAAIDIGQGSPIERIIDKIIAVLSYDSLNDPLPLGVRTGVSSRQLVFTAGDREVTITIQKSSEQFFNLTGQLTGYDPRDLTVARVTLSVGPERTETTLMNSWGEFLVEHLPAPPYQLQITVGGVTVNVSVPPIQGS